MTEGVPAWYTRRFWESLAESEFVVGDCPDCGEAHFPPAPVCPVCGEAATMIPAEGTGTLYSFTRQHRTPPGFDSPAVIGTVELLEGPRVLMRVDAPYEALRIGQPVTVVIEPFDEEYDRGRTANYPMFGAEPE